MTDQTKDAPEPRNDENAGRPFVVDAWDDNTPNQSFFDRLRVAENTEDVRNDDAGN